MEYSPFSSDLPKRSGTNATTTEKRSHARNLFTPTLTNVTSRKRKVAETVTMGQSPSFDDTSLCSFDNNSMSNANFLSSTMNESLMHNLEKCNLDSFASNFYVERSELEQTPISFQSHDVLYGNSVIHMEPSTPTKNASGFYSNSVRSSPMQKLGSPERNKILYPSLVPTASVRLNDNGKRFSPAKKRLFVNGKKDPINFFWNKERKFPGVVLRIFQCLKDGDLYACSKVNSNWRDAVTYDHKMKKRIQMYAQRKLMEKENYCGKNCMSSPLGSDCCDSPLKEVESPILDTSKKFYEITNSLRDGQHLEKCLQCTEAAVVDRNISQCTRNQCGFIRCIKCNSLSTTGPEDFVDRCEQSRLLIDKPKSRYSLMSSPKRGVSDSGVPSFFLDESLNYSPTINTSGYVTDSDFSSHSNRHSSSFTREKSRVLQICNNMMDYTTTRRSSERRSSLVPVVPLNVKKVEEIIEPSSPPKVKDVAGSRKSKRNLRRLRLL